VKRRVTYPGPAGQCGIHRLGTFIRDVPREVELSADQAASLARKGWAVEEIGGKSGKTLKGVNDGE